MFEPGAGVRPTLVTQAQDALVDRFVIGRDNATLARCHLLVRIEREDRRRAVRADHLALAFGTQRLGAILDNRQAMSVGDPANLLDLAGQPEDMDRDDCLRAGRDRCLDGCWVKVERNRVDLGKNDVSARVECTVGRGDKREGRGDDLVAWSNPSLHETKMKTRRATRDRGGIFDAYPVGKGALKTRPHRTEREHARAQHLEHELFLARTNIRLREGDWCAGGAHLRRETRGKSSTVRVDRGPCRRTSSESAS